MEEISWIQKSRALWSREGDRNTKFFHGTANLRRKFNFMSAVVVDGNRFETADNMKSSVHGFYKELFTETESWRCKVDGLSLPSLTNAAKEVLEVHFGKDEITRALFDCYGNKAPGPDGMTMAFLQANQDTI